MILVLICAAVVIVPAGIVLGWFAWALPAPYV